MNDKRADWLLPPWIQYPELRPFSIGWRMGAGETYSHEFNQWYEELTEEGKQAYREHYPTPKILDYWDTTGYQWEDDYRCKGVMFWEQNGVSKYSKAQLIEEIKPREKLDFTFFWMMENDERACFSQWFPASFSVDADDYTCSEQYMMAEKARVFGDVETHQAIMATDSPREMKILGRQVKGFDAAIWDKVKYSVVLSGNWYKFTQNPKLARILLGTDPTILVEASPTDSIWGIGLTETRPEAQDPAQWQGENLLGFALMEVRDDIHRVYQNVEW
ncbi:MAG: NADAR family protein [Turicibacter sp.]|nr:NADAR family protein [Turicibacter sp.]